MAALPVFADPTGHVCDFEWNLGESPCCGNGEGNVIDVRGISYCFQGLRHGHVPVRGVLYNSYYHTYVGWTNGMQAFLTRNGQAPNPIIQSGHWSETGVFIRPFSSDGF
jgi:hypothetical protein